MELHFKEWTIEEGWFGKKLIPLFAAGALGIYSMPHLQQPTTAQPIQIAPEEIGIRIPDSPQKGFAFSIKHFAPVSENDINITNIRSGKGGLANVGLQTILKTVNVKKEIAKNLNGQSEYGYSSLPPGTAVDNSRKQQIPNKIVTIVLEDWPIFAGTPFDPVHVSGTVRLDLRQGEAWVAPSKLASEYHVTQA